MTGGSADIYISQIPSSLTEVLSPMRSLEDKFALLLKRIELLDKSNSTPCISDMDEDFPTDLSASYIQRVGDAIGVRRTPTVKH